MKHCIIFCALIVAFLCSAECQITFSRSWVRGKLPGEGNPDGGEGDVPDVLKRMSFMPLYNSNYGEVPASADNRGGKSLKTRADPSQSQLQLSPEFLRDSRSFFNLRAKVLQDILKNKLKYMGHKRWSGSDYIHGSNEEAD